MGEIVETEHTMTQDKAAKYNGKWVQVKVDNMDAVMAETGMGWTTRKVAGMMTVNLEVEARDKGMFTSLKTKLKNTDNLLLYSGVTKTKGLSDDEDVEITVSFDAEDNLQQVSKITRAEKRSKLIVPSKSSTINSSSLR